MSNHQVGLPIPGLPLALYCISDASIVLTPTTNFKTFVEPFDGLQAIFDMEGFSIGEYEYSYNTKYWYKEDENLLSWLKHQNMEMPHL